MRKLFAAATTLLAAYALPAGAQPVGANGVPAGSLAHDSRASVSNSSARAQSKDVGAVVAVLPRSAGAGPVAILSLDNPVRPGARLVAVPMGQLSAGEARTATEAAPRPVLEDSANDLNWLQGGGG